MVRKAGNTKSLQVVQSMREVLVAKARVLDAALRKFKQHDPAAYQVEYKESGLYSFRQATESNYPAVSTFITTANKYLASYGPQLVGAGVMATSFPQEFKDAGVAYNATKTSLSTTRETAKGGTDKVISEVDKIKLEIRTMQDFGKATFHDEPELYKLFTEEYLKEAVRSRHPASLNGRTTWPKEPGMDQAKPVAGLKVEVLGMEGKSAVTNKKGRFEIKQLAAGEHRVRISAPKGEGNGIQPVELLVKLKPGVSLRQNVTVIEAVPPAEPEEERMAPKTATPTPASMKEALNNAMKDVTVNGER